MIVRGRVASSSSVQSEYSERFVSCQTQRLIQSAVRATIRGVYDVRDEVSTGSGSDLVRVGGRVDFIANETRSLPLPVLTP